MEKIIVCGGAGFVAQNLIPLLRKNSKKYHIIAIDKHAENLKFLKEENPDVEVIYADLSEQGDWESSFKDAKAVIQLNAQIAAPDENPFIKNNVTATELILKAMKKYKVPYIVHTSSAAVDSIRLDNYARTKKEGEEKVTSQKNIKYSVLRPSMMYGLFDNKNVGWLIQFMKKTPVFPIPGSGDYPRQPVFVMDYARIIEYLIEKQPENKIYKINGDEISFINMVRAIRRSRKLKRPLVKLPLPVFISMMTSYNKIRGKVEFTADQVRSLTSGETFEEFPWWKEFKLKKTGFREGLMQMARSPKRDIMLKR